MSVRQLCWQGDGPVIEHICEGVRAVPKLGWDNSLRHGGASGALTARVACDLFDDSHQARSPFRAH